MNYYNEFDPKAAAWLRELIFAGEIPDGIVDERSITEIKPHELSDYTQCHFFAGIGGWSLALKLAGWPEDKPVWTGSCPCQPFSSAGQGKGEEDERHLWPAFFNLIRERKPECVFGEQVASAIGHGWLDGISADLEGEGYACGAVVLGAHSVGAPHIRQRLYWVADANLSKRDGWTRVGEQPICCENEVACGLAYTSHERHRNIRDGATGWGESERSGGLGNSHIPENNSAEPGQSMPGAGCDSELRDGRTVQGVGEICSGGMEYAASNGCQVGPQLHGEHDGKKFGDGCESFRLGHSNHPRPQGRDGQELRECADKQAAWPGGAWDNFQLIPCRDGKSRRIESGSFPLAHGIPGRVGLLRGYGNAIVPQVAAEFIGAWMDTLTPPATVCPTAGTHAV